MEATNRRYYIDWIRVIAIGLLLIYHTAIGFQPWGMFVGFITSEKPWLSLWSPMLMLNVWRIPLLFVVSGMGVYFAIQNRNWKQFLLERASRILVPFIFGVFCIVPVHLYIWSNYYKMNTGYGPALSHLWFLGNIFIYVLLFLPLCFYLKKNQEGTLATALKWSMKTPAGILPMIAAFVAESLLVDPRPYEVYAMTAHGFFLGMISFLFGFLFVLSGEVFWKMIVRWRWLFFSLAVMLFFWRFSQAELYSSILIPVESCCWIMTVFAFGCRYLNHSGQVLAYLSSAAYPVYILHMIFLYQASASIFPLDLPVQLKYAIILLLTLGGCFGTFEIIKRVNILRVLFGMKVQSKTAVGNSVRSII